MNFGTLKEPINWLNQPNPARAVIILGLVWRWTGYNMVFFLSGMQGIEYSIYEAARIDGANLFQQLIRITIPLLKPIILVTGIMSTNGTLQLFDESVNLTGGGPANMTITMSHYIYNTMFTKNPNFGYAAAMSFVILIMVAILSAIEMKVGDKR
jgi:lactose/L-arabinose transport system permease protein